MQLIPVESVLMGRVSPSPGWQRILLLFLLHDVLHVDPLLG